MRGNNMTDEFEIYKQKCIDNETKYEKILKQQEELHLTKPIYDPGFFFDFHWDCPSCHKRVKSVMLNNHTYYKCPCGYEYVMY